MFCSSKTHINGLMEEVGSKEIAKENDDCKSNGDGSDESDYYDNA